MSRGIVRWYNKEKGFGFIIPDEGGKDVYVQSAHVDTPDQELMDNQRVEFELVLGRKGPEATHVRSAD
jgi:CspA family cold shock protein